MHGRTTPARIAAPSGGLDCGMGGRGSMARHGFWLLAPIWLPAGVMTPSAAGFAESGEVLAVGGSLAVAVPCGLPLALGCRRL